MTATLDDLQADLFGTSPWKIAEAAETLAERVSAVDPDFKVTVYDNFWRYNGDADEWIALNGTLPRNDVPSAEIKNPQSEDDLIDKFQACRKSLVGVTIETEGIRQAYYLDSHEYELANGMWTSTAKCLGIYDILNYIYVWPDWYLPIQAQLFAYAIFIGPLCTVLAVMIAENALRLQLGIWEFVNNALSLNADFQAWIGSMLESNGNIGEALKTPVYVVPINPILDTSPWVAFTVRMESCKTIIDKMARAYGVTVTVDLWLPGDPQPDQYANLDQATYVVRIIDRQNLTGPTQTAIDGIIGDMVQIEGSVFGDTFSWALNPNNTTPSLDGIYIAPTIGENFVEPWAVLIDDPHGPMISAKIIDHAPQGDTMIIGGKSPQWLNQLINATLSWLIDSIMIVIGFTGVPSDLLSGFLNDSFLAFQLVENFTRRANSGPYARREKFIATNSAPYNIEALFSFVNAFWDSRGYRSAIVTWRNGEPYTMGKDCFVGGLMSVYSRGWLFSDYVELMMFRATRQERQITVQIGDGKAEEAPLAKYQRDLTGLQEAFNVVSLAPQS